MHCSRRRLLRRGLEFHVCTIYKSVHTKKSGNLFNDPRIYIYIYSNPIELIIWNRSFIYIYIYTESVRKTMSMEYSYLEYMIDFEKGSTWPKCERDRCTETNGDGGRRRQTTILTHNFFFSWPYHAVLSSRPHFTLLLLLGRGGALNQRPTMGRFVQHLPPCIFIPSGYITHTHIYIYIYIYICKHMCTCIYMHSFDNYTWMC